MHKKVKPFKRLIYRPKNIEQVGFSVFLRRKPPSPDTARTLRASVGASSPANSHHDPSWSSCASPSIPFHRASIGTPSTYANCSHTRSGHQHESATGSKSSSDAANGHSHPSPTADNTTTTAAAAKYSVRVESVLRHSFLDAHKHIFYGAVAKTITSPGRQE